MELIEGWTTVDFNKIVDLYDFVGWSTYTKNKDSLQKALENSTCVFLAVMDGDVLGLSRSISDEVSIHYLQDILVHTDHQKKGVGRLLLSRVLKRFEDVRTHMILTDDEERQKLFYQSLGYKNVNQLKKHKLNAYIKMKNIELE